jgi:hypothetical protein
MCIAPESLVRKTRHAAVISTNAPNVVVPAKFRPLQARATASHMAFSDADPKTATAPSISVASLAAASANRSGSHRFAEP